MPSQKKIQSVTELQEKVGRAQSITFAKYSGMNVRQMSQLRRAVGAAGGEVVVTRNRLMNIALQKPEGLAEHLQDQIITLFSYVDPVTPLKTLVKFAEDNGLPELKAGFFENKVLNVDGVKQLSKTPSKPELISMLLRQLQVPGQNLHGVLQAGTRNLVYALKAIEEKKK